MDRRQAIFTLVCASGALLVTTARSQSAGPRRIGVLMVGSSAEAVIQSRIATFEGELTKLGWKKGTNLLIDYRFADGDSSRLVSLARQALSLKPELVVGFTESAAIALRQVTLSVPIVFVQVPDPVAAGFVTNLARPEGNITGFTNFDTSIGAKWLQVIKECAPEVSRVAIVFDPTNAAWRAYVRAVELGAKNSGVSLSPLSVKSAADLEKEVSTFAKLPNGGLVVLPGGALTTHRAVIISLAARYRLPAIYPYSYFAAAGGLMSYGVDLAHIYRGGASYVDRILKGARPADLPIQQPTQFEFAINLRTAKTLGITLPQSVLQRADKIID